MSSLKSLLLNTSRKPPVTPFKAWELTNSFRRSIKTCRASLATLMLFLLTPMTSWATQSISETTISACSLTPPQFKMKWRNLPPCKFKWIVPKHKTMFKNHLSTATLQPSPVLAFEHDELMRRDPLDKKKVGAISQLNYKWI